MIPTKAFDIAHTVAIYLAGHYERNEDNYSDYYDALRSLRNEVSRGKQKFGYRTKVKESHGCYRTAFVFPDFVIKFSSDRDRQADLKSEYEFITKARKNKRISRHFPETHIVQIDEVYVQIQEKVDMNHRGRDTSSAETLGEVLGLEDMHTGNFGWKGRKGKEYPVFIDVDFRGCQSIEVPRARKPKLRSWQIMAMAGGNNRRDSWY